MSGSSEEFVQVQMERPELAAVIARGDLQHPWPARGSHADARRLLDRGEDVLAHKLAVHHRHAPEAPVAELLAELKRVAEEAQIAADLERPCLVNRQSVVAGRRRAGQHTLADAIDEGLL